LQSVDNREQEANNTLFFVSMHKIL